MIHTRKTGIISTVFVVPLNILFTSKGLSPAMEAFPPSRLNPKPAEVFSNSTQMTSFMSRFGSVTEYTQHLVMQLTVNYKLGLVGFVFAAVTKQIRVQFIYKLECVVTQFLRSECILSQLWRADGSKCIYAQRHFHFAYSTKTCHCIFVGKIKIELSKASKRQQKNWKKIIKNSVENVSFSFICFYFIIQWITSF